MQHRKFLSLVGGIVAIGFAGAAVAGPADEHIDLSGAGFGPNGIPGESFGLSGQAASGHGHDEMMSTLLVDDSPEGGTPTPAPLPVSGAMGAVGLGLLASRRRRRQSL